MTRRAAKRAVELTIPAVAVIACAAWGVWPAIGVGLAAILLLNMAVGFIYGPR